MYPKIRIILVLMLFLSTSISRAQDCTPKISGAVSYGDWITNAENVTFFLDEITLEAIKTPAGIDLMMSKLKSSGIKRVYWRIYNGGAVTFDAQVKGLDGILYTSEYTKTETITAGNTTTTTITPYYDFVDIDATFYANEGMSNMEYAIKKAHDNDIEILAWFTLAEEMHSGKCPISKFAVLNYNDDDYFEHGLNDLNQVIKWKGRLNFANQAVRDHKVDMIQKITNIGNLTNTNGNPSSGEIFDGVFLDFTRRGLPDFVIQAEADSCDDQVSSIYDIINTFNTSLEVRDSNDVSIFGYDAISIQDFGVPLGNIVNSDPNWIAHRASYWTTFMQELDFAISKPIISHVFETDAEATLKGDLLDWGEWLNQDYIDGISFLINNTDDGIMVGNNWNALPDPYTKAFSIINDRKIEVQNIKPDAEVIASIYNYTNIPGDLLLATNYHIIEELTAYAFEAQANEIMWWETNWFYVWEMHDGTNYNVNEAVIEFGANSENNLLISGNSNESLNNGVVFKEYPIGDDLFNLYNVTNKITIENYEIQSTGNSYFVACDEIDFLPNFTVNSGEFTAMISKVSQSSYLNGNNSFRAVLNIPDDIKQDKDIVVYPNPSTGIISIGNVKSTDILKIQLIDLNGRVLNLKKIDSNDGISLKIKNKGFFILKIETDKAVFSRRIIIN